MIYEIHTEAATTWRKLSAKLSAKRALRVLNAYQPHVMAVYRYRTEADWQAAETIYRR